MDGNGLKRSRAAEEPLAPLSYKESIPVIDLKDTCFIETGLMYFARGGEHVVDLLCTEEKHPFGYFTIYFFLHK